VTTTTFQPLHLAFRGVSVIAIAFPVTVIPIAVGAIAKPIVPAVRGGETVERHVRG